MPGPTGPCCTGPAGSDGVVACGSLSNSFDPEFPELGCQLVVFRFVGVVAMEEFLVSPTARGWMLTFDPALDLRGVKVAVSEEIQLDFSESPPVVLKYQRLPPAAPDAGARILFWLQDSSTGQPVDPCCNENLFSAYSFTLLGCGAEFNFIFADAPIPSPCPLPPPGLAAARAASTTPRALPEDRAQIARARRR